MRSVILLLAVVAAPAEAQEFDPLAPYIRPGQDEAGYRDWYSASPERPIRVAGLHHYLTRWGAGWVLPTWHIARTATDWSKCNDQPFEVPPTSEWPNIVQTLRYVRDEVIPAVGPVQAVSAYRNPVLNACAGGSPASAHIGFFAVDLVPLTPVTREELIHTMCAVHDRRGEAYGAGLGFYAFLRFHVDSRGFRRWVPAAANVECEPIVLEPEAATNR